MEMPRTVAGCASNDHVSTDIDNTVRNNAALFIKIHCLSFMNGLKRLFQVSVKITGGKI